MADGERTEAPTPRRLEQIRQRGEVARSAELPIAVSLLAGAVALRFAMPPAMEGLQEILRDTLLHPEAVSVDPDAFRRQAMDLGLRAMAMLVPLLFGVMVAGVLSNLIQVGGLFTPSAILPRGSRINPLSGLRRIFSAQGLVELGKSAVKLIIIAAVIFQGLAEHQGTLFMLLRQDVVSATIWLANLGADLMIRVAFTFLVLAAGDYLFQRWQFGRQARMTREEFKEEMRATEGSPEMRARMRQYARTLAMRRMMQAVPAADVVVTNPTHIAVAIKYTFGTRAPRVVAKGQRLIAERIKEIAQAAGVPIIENRLLAAALYKTVEIGAEIPAAFYQIVAEILAVVYRMRPPSARLA